MNKTLLATSLAIAGGLTALPAHAVCPVCTIAVGAGLGLSRYFGIDDAVSGVWIGGLIVSLTFWTADWLTRKNLKIKGLRIWTAIGYILITILPLYWTGIMGHPYNQLWSVDKLLLGMTFGGVVFWAVAELYELLKKRNGGHAWFPYQKVVMPVGILALLSLAFFILTK